MSSCCDNVSRQKSNHQHITMCSGKPEAFDCNAPD